MEVAIEVEDDLFFADLNRQISRLIMDDEDIHQGPSAYSSLSLQENFQRLNKLEDFSNGIQGRGEVPFGYENYIQTRNAKAQESSFLAHWNQEEQEIATGIQDALPIPLGPREFLVTAHASSIPIPHSLLTQSTLEVMASSFHQRL